MSVDTEPRNELNTYSGNRYTSNDAGALAASAAIHLLSNEYAVTGLHYNISMCITGVVAAIRARPSLTCQHYCIVT